MQDQCLNEFEKQWPLAEPKEKAQILSAMIMYVKRRYDVMNFRVNIDSKTKELEQIVENGYYISNIKVMLELKDFLQVSRAISYARKQIKEIGNTYGGGLSRAPRGKDLREARSFKRIVIADITDIGEEGDLDSDADDDF